MNRAFHRLRTAAFVVLSISSLLFGPRAAALVIDDFSRGGLSLQATNNNNFDPARTVVQTGLNPSFTLGGSRSVFVGSLSLATANIDTNTGRFNFFANAGYGYFTLGWGTTTPLNIDLTGNNAFRLDVVDASPGLGAALLDLMIRSGDVWHRYEFSDDLAAALGGQSFGSVQIPFAKFTGVNFSQVQAIELDAARVPANLRLSIDSFSVVPEPTVVALTGLAFALALLRRRHRTNHPGH